MANQSTGPWLVVMRCEGVQVGEGNRQINVYTYRLKDPILDLTALLRREDVQKALQKVIENPGDALLRRKAANVMRTAPWRLTRHDVVTLGPAERLESGRKTSDDLMDATVEGSIIIRDCQNVQIGNHNTQRNEHTLLFRTSRVNTVELLDKAPKVARALVDVVTAPYSDKRLESKLHTELTRALNAQPCHPESISHRIVPGESTSISDGYGVSAYRWNNGRVINKGQYDVEISEIGTQVREATMDALPSLTHVDQPSEPDQDFDIPDAEIGRSLGGFTL
ncbi:RIP homotypic interaction motif-containing protein [Streptomyces sp. NPDC001260]|uniref:RIP homotypic interaction motif-containing protein n=1 Tax=Streptomyces sp. NPDC001260 TaxID=3364551 RepID=UPI0036A96536